MRLHILFILVVLFFSCTNMNTDNVETFFTVVPRDFQLNKKISISNNNDSLIKFIEFKYQLIIDSSDCNLYRFDCHLKNNSEFDQYFLGFTCDNNGFFMHGNPSLGIGGCILCNVSFPIVESIKKNSKRIISVPIATISKVYKVEKYNFFFYPLSKSDYDNENFRDEFKYNSPKQINPYLIQGTEIK